MAAQAPTLAFVLRVVFPLTEPRKPPGLCKGKNNSQHLCVTWGAANGGLRDAGPRRTKNTTRSKFTTRSIFTITL